MSWIRPLSTQLEDAADLVGSKAIGLVAGLRLGLPVPPGFVITADACRAFLQDGRVPDGLDAELVAALAELEATTGRRFGGRRRPLAVSVRSGAGVSMPGMMTTILNVGLTTAATAGLAAETGDRGFAAGARRQFLAGVAATAADRPHRVQTHSDTDVPADPVVADDAVAHVIFAITAVFSSWASPRARTYRELQEIPHDLGTAVIVQAMVFGNRDAHSGTGVAFSRNPNTGVAVPFGDVLFGEQGDAVVSGRSLTRPLAELADREPVAWNRLLDALRRVEGHYRDACYLEFTVEKGVLWVLQLRPGRFVGAAAIRVATDLADAGLISRDEAVLRVTPGHLRHARTPRIAITQRTDILARGVGASPGVAGGAVATSSDTAALLAVDGPVVLFRPETSPLDMHGLAVAGGIVTTRGGPASHAAVVARALGKPAVVGVVDLTVDDAARSVTLGGRTVGEGEKVTIDGTSGEVVLGNALVTAGAAEAALATLLRWADELSGERSTQNDAERLAAAHSALRAREVRSGLDAPP